MLNYVLTYGNASKGRLYASQINDFDPLPWFTRCGDLSRRQICILNRLRSGHSRARAHLASKRFTVDESCECGEGLHNVEHLIWDCSSFSEHRSRLLSRCRVLGIPLGSGLSHVSFNFSNIFKDLSNFIINSNIPM